MAFTLINVIYAIASIVLLSADGILGRAEVLTFPTLSNEAITISGGYCEKNISTKYQVPVMRKRIERHIISVEAEQQQQQQQHQQQHNNDKQIDEERVTSAPSAATATITTAQKNNVSNSNNANSKDANQGNEDNDAEEYLAFEDRIRWDVEYICCPGYRTLLFGFCAPICTHACPPFSYCATPEKCACLPGYEPSHHPNKQHQLICRPVCMGGCPEHSQCVARNRCECRPGYKDISKWWFQPLRCERIQCGADQRYDVERRGCVKIEMSMEELMQRVAEKLSRGLNATSSEEVESAEDERVAEKGAGKDAGDNTHVIVTS